MKDKRLYLIALLFFIPVFLYPENYLCEGVWLPISWNNYEGFVFEWNLHPMEFSWGIGKNKGPASIIIDIGKATYIDDVRGYTVDSVEIIDSNAEKITVSYEIPVSYIEGREYQSFIFSFINKDSIYLYAYKQGTDIHKIPTTARKYIRISGPARIPVKNAVLNDTRVRCRTEPNLNCETWGYLNTGDKVLIKDISDDPFEIDDESWYWYKVESDTLPDGWVYGKYLDIEE